MRDKPLNVCPTCSRNGQQRSQWLQWHFIRVFFFFFWFSAFYSNFFAHVIVDGPDENIGFSTDSMVDSMLFYSTLVCHSTNMCSIYFAADNTADRHLCSFHCGYFISRNREKKINGFTLARTSYAARHAKSSYIERAHYAAPVAIAAIDHDLGTRLSFVVHLNTSRTMDDPLDRGTCA